MNDTPKDTHPKGTNPKGINPDLWDFPLQHNFKVMGNAEHPIAAIVTEVIQEFVPEFDGSNITTKSSRTGKYDSITAVVTIDTKEQLEAIYHALAARDEIAWTL